MKENTPTAILSLGFIVITDSDGSQIYLGTDEWEGLRAQVDDMVQDRQPVKLEADRIWAEAPPKARERSSKAQLYKAWRSHRSKAPSLDFVLDALGTWKQSKSWLDGYAEGIHRWVNNHRWEVQPELAVGKSDNFSSSDVGI